RIVHEILEVAGALHGREAPLHALQLCPVQIRHRRDLGSAGLREVPDQVRSPVAVADDADPDHAVVPRAVEMRRIPARMAARPTTCRGVSGSLKITTAPAGTSVKVQLIRTGYAMLKGSVATTRNHTTLATKYSTNPIANSGCMNSFTRACSIPDGPPSEKPPAASIPPRSRRLAAIVKAAVRSTKERPVADMLDHSRVRASPTIRAGTPTTIAWSGTSFVTTAPPPGRAPTPTVTPARMVALLPMDARVLTTVSIPCQMG